MLFLVLFGKENINRYNFFSSKEILLIYNKDSERYKMIAIFMSYPENARFQA